MARTGYIGPPEKETGFTSRFGDKPGWDIPIPPITSQFGDKPGGGYLNPFAGPESAAGPVAAQSGVSEAGAVLGEIFAPAASQGASQASPGVVSTADSYQAPALIEPDAAVPGPSSSSGSGGGGGGAGTWNGIDGWLQMLMDMFVNNSGMGDDLKSDLRNEATQTGKFRERDRIMRRADDFAARGLFGSGLRKDAVMGIEGEESVALQGALNQIEFKDAEMKAQGLRDSIQVLNAMIAKKLGQGNLNIQREMVALDRARLELQNAMFDFDQAKWWALNPPGGDGADAPPPPPPPPGGGGGYGGGGGAGGGGGGGNPYAPNPGTDIYANQTNSNSELLRSMFGDPRGINSSWGGQAPESFGWGGGGGSHVGWASPDWQLY